MAPLLWEQSYFLVAWIAQGVENLPLKVWSIVT